MNLIKLSAIDSTNNYLKRELAKGVVKDETVIWALEQNKGRGQQGASWQSKTGVSLTISVLKKYQQLSTAHLQSINLAVSLGVYDALEQLSIPAISIKWPNDIMSYQKKICGILIENQLADGTIKSSIIGLGINVNQDSFSGLPHAGSMYLSSGKKFELEVVLTTVVEHVLTRLNTLGELPPGDLKAQYEEQLFRKDKVSVFESPVGEKFVGIIKGVATDGNLIVQLEDDTLKKFANKELKMHY